MGQCSSVFVILLLGLNIAISLSESTSQSEVVPKYYKYNIEKS